MSDLDGEAVLSLEDEECDTFDGFSPKDVSVAQKKFEKKRTSKRGKVEEKSRGKKREKKVSFAMNLDKLSANDIDLLKTKLGLSENNSAMHEHEEREHDPVDPDLTCHYDSNMSDDWLENDCEEWQPPKLKTPDRGELIKESLARLIETAFTAQCATDTITDKYKVPRNCDKIEPPLVNPEVWGEVNKKAHSDDKSLRVVQSLITAGVLPIIKLAEDPRFNSSKEVRSIFQDSLTLLGQVQLNISLRRRYQLRPHLRKKYSKLCSLGTPITTNLFGDDLAKEMKRCESSVRIGRESSWPPQSLRGRGSTFRRNNPYPAQTTRRGYFSKRGSYGHRDSRPRGRGRLSGTAPNPNVESGIQ